MPDEMARWLVEHARLLGSLSPGEPTEDLEPLRGMLNGVRVVGLGESTHGTSEFFRLKHRIVEYLVQEMGFNTLAMEASASAARALDAYVRYGTGDPAQLVARLGFWTWRTQELLDLVKWLYAYNREVSEGQRVRFAGIDPQRCADSVAAVTAVVRAVAPEQEALLREVEVLAQAAPASGPDPEQSLMARAEAVVALLAGLRDECMRHLAATGAPEPSGAFEEVLEHARILVRAADLVTRPREPLPGEDSVFSARDRYMADAVTRLVDDGSASRTVVWAHNGHISKGTYGAGVPALGSRLRDRFGDGYYALALLFGKGSFLARRRADVHGRPVRHRIGTGLRSVEARLADALPGDYFVDLRTATSSPSAAWLHAPQAQRSFGAAVARFTYRFDVAPLVPADDYDGIAFVARSSCSHLLPPAGL
ncbi:erythromycin esterase family protein [Streptomyces noursei]|uniref:erythromycin esterase family protein n=1 Tax=Streptomyces noursei TaxID=1971 RepID=UPI00045F0075|nr:erythromycin esterase family protein [Streptomyces noursei]AIA02558.1 erythromycin esterase-like protein [Streptomyces noursei]